MKNRQNKLAPYIQSILIALVPLLTGAADMPDPTKPPDRLIPASRKLNVSGALKLSAIFIYPDHRFAVINGHTARVGDKISEYTIINIQHDTVELKGSQDKPLVLSILPTVKTAK